MPVKFRIVPAAHPPFFNNIKDEIRHRSDLQGQEKYRPPQPLSRVNRGSKSIQVPDYLPEGFDANQALVNGLEEMQPLLIFPHQEEGKGEILLSTSALQLHPHEIVAPHAYRTLSIADKEAYLIHGSWAIRFDRDGNFVSVGWEDDLLLKLIVIDGNHVTMIQARPADLVEEGDLLRMVESLPHDAFSIYLPTVASVP